MTRLPSPSSRSSSETSLPLDLNSGLTAHLQAVLFQSPATECAVIQNSEALGAGVPSLLPSLTEKGLASFTKKVSFGVVGGGYDTEQLLQQLGKSMNDTCWFY